jgi:hypothetical protein
MSDLTELPVYPIFDGFQLTPLGLLVTGTPGFDAWSETFTKLTQLSEGSQWGLGDWLAYGEGRGDWGETYAQAIDLTKKSYSTLSKLVWVAKVFEYGRRRPKLSFSHHVEVAKMEVSEQDAWLDQAELNDWSRDELREAIKASKADVPNVVDMADATSKWLDCGHPRAALDKPTQTCRWCLEVSKLKVELDQVTNTLKEIAEAMPGISDVLTPGAKAVFDDILNGLKPVAVDMPAVEEAVADGESEAAVEPKKRGRKKKAA